MTEHVMIPILLDKTSKISLRLVDSMNLRGDGWRCGLKSFSLDKKWSLINEKITLIYTNGYKSVLQPKTTHSVTKLYGVVAEMFPKLKSKRDFPDLMDEIINEPIKKKRMPTPPPSLIPMKSPLSVDEKGVSEQKSPTPPPSLLSYDNSPLKIVTINDDKMTSVALPTNEPNKRSDKQYIVYKSLKDAFFYSPELPTTANHFTKHAAQSVNFIFNGETNRYNVNFDEKYIRAIHFTKGFARALGFSEVVLPTEKEAPFAPNIEGFHSHICVHINDIICPVHCGTTKENVLDILPITQNNNPISIIYERPKYIKLSVNTFNVIEIEFKDIFGNPIVGDNAYGHIILEFVKKP